MEISEDGSKVARHATVTEKLVRIVRIDDVLGITLRDTKPDEPGHPGVLSLRDGHEQLSDDTSKGSGDIHKEEGERAAVELGAIHMGLDNEVPKCCAASVETSTKLRRTRDLGSDSM